MLRINLLPSAPIPPSPTRESFWTRREVRLGAGVLAVAGALVLYLASRRTVVLPPASSAGTKTAEAIASAPPRQPEPAPLRAPKGGASSRSASAPKTEPVSSVAKAIRPAHTAKAPPPAPASPATPFQLTEISIQQQKGALVLLAHIGPGALKYQTMKLENPSRLVIDLSNCRLVVPPSQCSRAVEHSKVKRVRIAQFQTDPPLARIVLDMATFPRYQIRPDPQGLEIKVLDGPP